MEKEEIVKIAKDAITKGNSLAPFKIDPEKVVFSFRLRSGCSGIATIKKYIPYLKFNLMIARANPHLYRNTVLHEAAHLFAFVFGDYNHGDIWRKIFIDLGGNGETYHSMNIPTYTECFCKCGRKHLISSRQYKRMKNGIPYSCKICGSVLFLTK